MKFIIPSPQGQLLKQQRDHSFEVMRLQNRITTNARSYELKIRELEKQLKKASTTTSSFSSTSTFG